MTQGTPMGTGDLFGGPFGDSFGGPLTLGDLLVRFAGEGGEDGEIVTLESLVAEDRGFRHLFAPERARFVYELKDGGWLATFATPEGRLTLFELGEGEGPALLAAGVPRGR